MGRRKITSRTETKIFDRETGQEVASEQETSYTVPQEPPFIKVYLRDILYLSDLPSGYTPLLDALLKRVSYADSTHPQCVVLTAGIKRAIAKECGWKSLQSVDNALRALTKGRVLLRVPRSDGEGYERGIYQLNPYLFGRGPWPAIEKIRLEVTYDIHGTTFKAAVKASKPKKTTTPVVRRPSASATQPQPPAAF